MQYGTIDKRPDFVRYWQHLAERPAARRATEIDTALAAKLQKGR
jgi:glutathione S-transferase